MEPSEMDRLEATLKAMRPEPRPDFAAELDARAAAGFPRQEREGSSPHAQLWDWLRSLELGRMVLPVGAAAVVAIAIATVVVSNTGGGRSDSAIVDQESTSSSSEAGAGAAPDRTAEAAPSSGDVEASGAEESGGFLDESAAGTAVAPSSPGNAAGQTQRKIESSAEITLGTDPAGVADASAKVFDTVHQFRGIVLNSSTTEGMAGDAGAEFELLIPSGKLPDALAAFSGIAEVRSRHEATTDITGPTVGVSEHLDDSQARIDSLLGQLSDAESEEERELVEAELRGERGRAANLRSQLERLDRRANLATVSLRIETGEDSSPDEEEGGTWGIADAFDDAGGILSTAAAVSLVALAVLGPIALLALLAWLGRRAYTHAARTRALG